MGRRRRRTSFAEDIWLALTAGYWPALLVAAIFFAIPYVFEWFLSRPSDSEILNIARDALKTTWGPPVRVVCFIVMSLALMAASYFAFKDLIDRE